MWLTRVSEGFRVSSGKRKTRVGSTRRNVIKIETKSEWSSQRRNEGCYSMWADVLRVLLRMANTRPYWVRPLRLLEWSGEMSGKILFIFEQARNGAGYQI